MDERLAHRVLTGGRPAPRRAIPRAPAPAIPASATVPAPPRLPRVLAAPPQQRRPPLAPQPTQKLRRRLIATTHLAPVPSLPTPYASQINPAYPIYGTPTTQSVRDNFGHARDEINALQMGKLDLAGGTMTGRLTLWGPPTLPSDAATRQYVDDSTAGGDFLPITGGALLGPLSMSNNKITQLADATSAQDALNTRVGDARYYAASNPAGYQTAAQVSAVVGNYLPLAGGTLSGSLGVNGNLDCLNQITGGNVISTGSIMNYSGAFYVANNYAYYLARNPNNGEWTFVDANNALAAVRSDGSFWASSYISTPSYIQANNYIYGVGGLYACNTEMYFGYGGSGRTMQMAPSCYWDFLSDASLVWNRFGAQIIAARSDGILGNYQWYVAGNGDYSNWSDARLKDQIEDAEYGLAHVRQLRVRRFVRKATRGLPTPPIEIGFVAQEVMDVVPEAVTALTVPAGALPIDSDTALAVQGGMITAILVNGMQELAEIADTITDRMATLEARIGV
jgi:hypothetical protein